jgi:hypothetical protein
MRKNRTTLLTCEAPSDELKRSGRDMSLFCNDSNTSPSRKLRFGFLVPEKFSIQNRPAAAQHSGWFRDWEACRSRSFRARFGAEGAGDVASLCGQNGDCADRNARAG